MGKQYLFYLGLLSLKERGLGVPSDRPGNSAVKVSFLCAQLAPLLSCFSFCAFRCVGTQVHIALKEAIQQAATFLCGGIRSMVSRCPWFHPKKFCGQRILQLSQEGQCTPCP